MKTPKDLDQIQSLLEGSASLEVRHRAHELIRARNDFPHFVNTYCYIQDRITGSDVPFRLWPGQKRVLPVIMGSIYTIILKARQLGLTWLVAAYALWRANFRFEELIVVISAKEELAIEFLDRVRYLFDRLPVWMRAKVYKRSGTELHFAEEEKDEKGNRILRGLNSQIKSVPSTPDAGQSKTISLLVMDESALNRYCTEIWSAAKPTLEHAKGQAIVISNPTKIGPGWGWTRDLYRGSMKGENLFKRIFLDWSCVPGRGPDFLQMQHQAGLDQDDISMQYPSTEEEAISPIGGSYFGRTISSYRPYHGEIGTLTKTTTPTGKPVFTFERQRGGILEVWQHPQKGFVNRYAIGSDVAEGLGLSYSVAYVYDRVDNRYVARMRSNKIDADIWANWLAGLGHYYEEACIGIEKNGAGITTIEAMKQTYFNLFYRQRPGKIGGSYVQEYGWLETNEAKQILADELKRHFRELFSQVPCSVLIDECSTFIRHENGKLAHEDGKLDDCVIAAGITLQVSLKMPAVEEVQHVRGPGPVEKRLEALEKGVRDDFERYVHSQIGISMEDDLDDDPFGGRIYHDVG